MDTNFFQNIEKMEESNPDNMNGSSNRLHSKKRIVFSSNSRPPRRIGINMYQQNQVLIQLPYDILLIIIHKHISLIDNSPYPKFPRICCSYYFSQQTFFASEILDSEKAIQFEKRKGNSRIIWKP